MGGVATLNNRPNIPLDQISCWDEQVHDFREEAANSTTRTNGKGEWKAFLHNLSLKKNNPVIIIIIYYSIISFFKTFTLF